MSSLCFRALWILTPAIGGLTLPVEGPPRATSTTQKPQHEVIHWLTIGQAASLRLARKKRVPQKAEMSTHTAHLNFSCTCGCTCTCKGTYADAKTIILTELLEMQAQGPWSCVPASTRGATVVLVVDDRGEQKVKRPEEREGSRIPSSFRLSVIARDLINSPLTNRTEQSRNPSNPVVHPALGQLCPSSRLWSSRLSSFFSRRRLPALKRICWTPLRNCCIN